MVADLAQPPEPRLSVRPGRYFVRGRGRDVLYEGTLDVTAGSVGRGSPTG